MRFPAAILAPLAFAPAMAQGAGQEVPFTLGQITVVAERPAASGIGIGDHGLDATAIWAFDRPTLDDAVDLLPGVVSSNSGGSRNERLIFVRGFDRFQVPVSIDGIRVYLPADNRFDFGRFLTGDIAELQVEKGYASVLDGPGAMGGAINLVTGKPTRPLEGEVRTTLDFDRDLGYAGYTLYGKLGTARQRWYAQASFARNDRDHWDLSGSYRPAPGSAEAGGERDFSAATDWRLNLKAGLVPNGSDEYALSYTRQEGSKNAPLHVTDPAALQRNWSWPVWNIDSLYFLSTTALGGQATLKTRIYRNGFDNLLRAFDDRTQQTQSRPRAFNSHYADRAWGGSAELAVEASAADRLSIAIHYRRDRHVEWQQSFPSGFIEPEQTNVEDSYSVAAENRLRLGPALALTIGLSYDWRDLLRAEEYGTAPGAAAPGISSYPLRNAGATNGQARLAWTPDDAVQAYLGVSSRTRFPTIFERFSTQFGTAASNPGLKAERATNYEVGGSWHSGALQVSGAVFASWISDAIVSVRPAGFPADSSQRQNLGNARYAGAELSFAATLAPALELGGNYGYIHRRFDIRGAAPGTVVPAFELTDVPAHKGLLYLDWKPVAGLRLLPGLELASDRTTMTTASPPVYYPTGSHALASLHADYRLQNGVELGVGVRNLFDGNHALTDGFPEPGRSFLLSARAAF